MKTAIELMAAGFQPAVIKITHGGFDTILIRIINMHVFLNNWQTQWSQHTEVYLRLD